MCNFKKDILRVSYEDFLPLSLISSDFTAFDITISESSTLLVDWGCSTNTRRNEVFC